MAEPVIQLAAETGAPEGARSVAKNLWRRSRRNKMFWTGTVLVLLFVLMAVFAPVVSRHDPIAMNLDIKLQAPGPEHWGGTDNFGRDVMARIFYGARISLLSALAAVSLAVGLGTVIGLLSGYMGGAVDMVVQRLVEVALAFPGLLLALAIVAVLGPGQFNVMLAVGLGGVPGYIRLVRGEVLAVKNREYVEAARALGASDRRMMYRHVLPNILSPVVVVATLGTAGAIQATAALSFLGMGAQPPTPAWGTMIAEGQSFLYNAWWMPTMPGLAIAVCILGFNLFGDGLRDLLDPKTVRK
ncbi:MAG: binding-protein-dependent transport system inner rane component [Firmicutes bacterium]|nr:binding-protein-dependent transport system inner rane component [Bacillota bacterium]